MKHEKKTFTDKKIVLDGNSYIGCSFSRCNFVYSGGLLELKGCDIHADNTWTFDGAAARTVTFMSMLYKQGAKSLIEATFENIRGKADSGIAVH